MPHERVCTEAASPPPTNAGTMAAARAPEPAQLVWRRALVLADPGALHDQLGLALDLLRMARHNPAVMAQASTLASTHLRTHAGDDRARAAAKILQSAIGFLGVKAAPMNEPPATT